MSGQIILPSAGAPFPSRTTIPADGDPANAASVAAAFTDLLNGVDRARAGLFGSKLRPRYYISDAGPATPKMTIQPLGTVVVTGSGGLWYSVPHTVSVEINLVVDANGGNNLLVKTRYYLYAYLSGGGLAYTVDVNGPESTLRYAQAGHGGTDLAYIGTFLTDPAVVNQVYLAHEQGGHHIVAGSAWQVLVGGGAAVSTSVFCYNTVDYGVIVPSYAKQILVAFLTSNSGVLEDTVAVGLDSAITISDFSVICAPGGSDYFALTTISLDGKLYYKWQNGGANSRLTILVRGWVDPR